MAVVGYVGGAVTEGERRRFVRDAYVKWGPAFSAHALGQYAAVVVDDRARRVVIAQDSLGVRPLFWARAGDHLVATSDAESAVALVGVGVLDEGYFSTYLASGRRPAGRTPFVGLRRLNGGEVVVVEPQGYRSIWPWAPPGCGDGPSGGVRAASRLAELVDEAVRFALPPPGEGPLLCELSGGLDSTTVLAAAAAHRPDVRALTVYSATGRAGDDLWYASAAVESLGVRWHRLDIDRSPPLSASHGTFRAEPGDELRAALFGAYRDLVVAVDARVVLTGMGGDDVLGGTRPPLLHIADPLWDGRLAAAVRAARQWEAVGRGSRTWTNWLLHHGVRPALRHLVRRRVIPEGGAPEWLAPRLVRRHRAWGGASRPLGPRLARPGCQDAWDQVLERAAEQGSPFRHHLGADTRHPLLHRPLVEFMLGVEPGLRSGPDGDRVLHREALRGRVPEAIRLRVTKSSDQALIERSLMLNPGTCDLLTRAPRLASLGWVRIGPWREAVSRARFGVVDGLRPFYAAVSTELWLRGLERREALPKPTLHPAMDDLSRPNLPVSRAHPNGGGTTSCRPHIQ